MTLPWLFLAQSNREAIFKFILSDELFGDIILKIQAHLDYGPLRVVLIVGINIYLELSTIADNLLTTLLKGCFHVLDWCRPNVCPQSQLHFALKNRGGVFGSNAAALRIGDVLIAHRLGNIMRAL